ncbi:MAG TPA: VOC family protein [Candidatus Bathyarchaeia archaeon]|nr:VOC family protein [Candidatus Bathyarchaeia archaeon]
MKSRIGHIYIYASDLEKSYQFYKKFLGYLDYRQNFKSKKFFAFIKDGTSIFFEQAPKDHLNDGYHRRRIGLNHLAFRVDSKEEVDRFNNDFLNANDIKTLYNTPKPFPKYEKGYYAVYFEDPDRIKLEVVYYP